MESLLKDRIAVVTGASRGIGQAIATAFLAEGARVYALSRSDASRPDTPSLVWIPCDVTDEAGLEAAWATVLEAEGRVDILVNNAGITKDGLAMRMKTEDWDAVLDANLKSAFILCRAASRQMLKQKSGCILNISSVVGISGNGGQANYAASKAGLIGLTKSLAKELAPRGIRVNALAPGFIETAMTDRIPEDFKARLKESIPLGRTGSPEEAASAALFLCSPLASYLTGVVLNVDGGMGM
ncbi:MAG TPA: 3-oxoacyl-[acyl-carrier-protein] reductase [Rectinemataceae bacterium]